MKKCKLLLLDLDGTLLQSDKTISTRTLSALKKCRENDILIGVSTSRSEQNSLVFLNELMPDILISSGGALVKYKTEYIYRAEFSEEETNVMIDMARNICGNDCEITIDTIDAHYWNYKIDPKKLDKSWGDSIYTDFSDFNECSLKMCVEIFNQDKADKLARSLSDCDCRVNDTGEETFGLLYFAEITEFTKELHSEMEKVVLMDKLPENWTYPLIQPKLIEKYLQMKNFVDDTL